MKQETVETCTKPLYISRQDIADLDDEGLQGEIFKELLDGYVADEALKNLNIIAHMYDMFPRDPLHALKYFDIAMSNMVVVGGEPQLGSIESWTGSAYSYTKAPSDPNLFQVKMFADFQKWNIREKAQHSNKNLQFEGQVLLLHEVLSTPKDAKLLNICKVLWEPFIFSILREISILDTGIPIVFTTGIAYSKFRRAVRTSKYVLCCDIKDSAYNTPNVFNPAQTIINKGRTKATEIDFCSIMSKDDK